ncbi:MAG: tetratricopeptide repeat protein [Anaerolineae bacterium]|nr:tetratricopeptide repeat protein [Anaerolineae bacterium]
MKRTAFVLTLVLMGLLLIITMPAAAQQPTITPFPRLATVTPAVGGQPPIAPTQLSDAVLQQIQRANAEATRQIEGANSVLSLVQGVTVLLVVLSILAALFGFAIFLEYRANLRNARELMGQVIDETKQMRVVQEAVKIRLGDLESLNTKVNDTLDEMHTDLRKELKDITDTNDRQVKDIQDVMNTRLRDLEAARAEVAESSQTMRNQIREQLQVVYDRSDRQMKALMDVLNGQIRDITAMRQQVEAASQEVRNQVRDQLQIVYDRGDKQVKDLMELHNQHRAAVDGTRREMLDISQTMRDQLRDGLLKIYERGDEQMTALNEVLNNHLKNFETLRKEIDAASQDMRTRIEQELETATANIGELELLQVRIDQSLQTMQTQLDDGMKRVTDHADKSAQAIGLVQLAQQQLHRGDVAGAIAHLEQASQLDPGNRALHYVTGDASVRQGDLTGGTEHLRQAGAGSGDYPSADVLYAYALRLQGDAAKNPAEREQLYNQAGAIFLKALEKNPHLLDASGESVFGALGSLYRRQQRLPQAVAFYQQAQKVTPHNSYPVNNLAILEWLQGNRDKAAQYFQQSLDLATRKLTVSPADYWAWFDRITAEIALGKAPEDVSQHLDTVLNVARDPDALHKFLDGLQELAQLPNPPASLNPVITRLKQVINAARNGAQQPLARPNS